MNILVIKSGIFGDHSNSTQLADKILASLKEKNPGAEVVERNVGIEALPYFDASVGMALNTPADQLTAEQKEIVALSDALIQEIKDADAVVLGLPMYNFGMPAQLKTWFDYITRAGVTFTYTETGPKGLLESKPVYIAAARGGVHYGQPTDSQTNHVTTLLTFLGMKEVSITYAEGIAMGDEAKATAFNQFEEKIAELV